MCADVLAIMMRDVERDIFSDLSFLVDYLLIDGPWSPIDGESTGTSQLLVTTWIFIFEEKE